MLRFHKVLSDSLLSNPNSTQKRKEKKPKKKSNISSKFKKRNIRKNIS